MRVGGQRHAPDALPLERDPVPIVQKPGWAPGPVSMGAKNLYLLGFDTRAVHLEVSRYTD